MPRPSSPHVTTFVLRKFVLRSKYLVAFALSTHHTPSLPTCAQMSTRTELEVTPLEGGATTSWELTSTHIVPRTCPEIEAIEQLDEERRRALPYLSRRRAAPELPTTLAVEAWPTPHPPPSTLDRPDPHPQANAPARTYAYDELWQEDARRQVDLWLTHATRALQSAKKGSKHKGPPTLVIPVAKALQPFAVGVLWDCRQRAACRPVVPSTTTDPPPSSLNVTFIERAAAELKWPDRELLHHVRCGVNDDAVCAPESIVLNFHHLGLLTNFRDADSAIRADVEAGFIHAGFSHLPVLPIRLVPRNIALQDKWSADDTGHLTVKQKPRLTTDDSWRFGGAAPARNDTIDAARWPTYGLPSTRDLGRAAAILLTVADAIGVKVLAYARDLSAAYRAWGVQRSRLFLQAFVWTTGVAL